MLISKLANLSCPIICFIKCHSGSREVFYHLQLNPHSYFKISRNPFFSVSCNVWSCVMLVFFCQIDEPNGFGNTPLHVACYMGQEAVATELVNHGANVNQPNKCGYTPLHLAAVSTNGALCLELLVNNGADVNQQVWNTAQCQSEKWLCSVL